MLRLLLVMQSFKSVRTARTKQKTLHAMNCTDGVDRTPALVARNVEILICRLLNQVVIRDLRHAC